MRQVTAESCLNVVFSRISATDFNISSILEAVVAIVIVPARPDRSILRMLLGSGFVNINNMPPKMDSPPMIDAPVAIS